MKKIIFILSSFILFFTLMAFVPDQSEQANAKIKAIYIYNFTKYIEWPEPYREGNFVIGVLGSNSSLLNELSKMASSKMVGSQKLEIRSISSCTTTDKYNIIYVVTDNSGQLNDVITKLKGKSTLIVTDKAGLSRQGSGINFIIDDNKQKIELNKANIERYKLKVASTLVEMSIPVK